MNRPKTQPRNIPHPEAATIPCMQCGRDFDSEHRVLNRHCDACKRRLDNDLPPNDGIPLSIR